MCPDVCPGLSDCYGENFKSYTLNMKMKEEELKQLKHVIYL